LACGGALNHPYLNVLRKKYLRILPIGIVAKNIRLEIGQKNPHVEFDIHDADIPSAVNYAEVAPILNLSIRSSVTSDLLADTMRRRKGLTVVAAGNDSKDINFRTAKVYPAAYGGRFSDRIITVAACTCNGELTSFSNYGSDVVDLAAPGCQITSFSLDMKAKTYDGTSVSAPLVSLTAALLYLSGIREAPAIKERILASVDFQPTLKGLLVSEGNLNIPKTLSFLDDVIQLRGDPRLIRGKILDSNVNLDGRPFSYRSDVLKIIPNYGLSGEARVYVKDLGFYSYEALVGHIKQPTLRFAVTKSDGAVEEKTYRYDELSDIVPALVK
jgi:hypothetical protein